MMPQSGLPNKYETFFLQDNFGKKKELDYNLTINVELI